MIAFTIGLANAQNSDYVLDKSGFASVSYKDGKWLVSAVKCFVVLYVNFVAM